MKGIDFDISLCEKAIERLIRKYIHVIFIKSLIFQAFILLIKYFFYCTRSSWVKNSEAKCKLKGSATYEDCIIELEWISSDSGTLDFGSFTILNVDGATTLVGFKMMTIHNSSYFIQDLLFTDAIFHLKNKVRCLLQ